MMKAAGLFKCGNIHFQDSLGGRAGNNHIYEFNHISCMLYLLV